MQCYTHIGTIGKDGHNPALEAIALGGELKERTEVPTRPVEDTFGYALCLAQSGKKTARLSP